MHPSQTKFTFPQPKSSSCPVQLTLTLARKTACVVVVLFTGSDLVGNLTVFVWSSFENKHKILKIFSEMLFKTRLFLCTQAMLITKNSRKLTEIKNSIGNYWLHLILIFFIYLLPCFLISFFVQREASSAEAVVLDNMSQFGS